MFYISGEIRERPGVYPFAVEAYVRTNQEDLATATWCKRMQAIWGGKPVPMSAKQVTDDYPVENSPVWEGK